MVRLRGRVVYAPDSAVSSNHPAVIKRPRVVLLTGVDDDIPEVGESDEREYCQTSSRYQTFVPEGLVNIITAVRDAGIISVPETRLFSAIVLRLFRNRFECGHRR